MNIRCIIVDDEPLALNKLKRNILKFPYLELVASCHSAEAAKKALETNDIDLVYIDINMPDVNGMDFIRSLKNPPMVIFVTAYSEYAVESYKVNAVDYLLKPYSSEDFKRTAEKAYRHWNLLHKNASSTDFSEEKVLYLKCDYRFLRVVCDDIVFIEGQNEYLKIHQVSGVPFLTHMTFRQIMESLPGNFIQVHRSYIINMKHMVSAERTQVIMDNGVQIPVSDTRRSVLLQYMNSTKSAVMGIYDATSATEAPTKEIRSEGDISS